MNYYPTKEHENATRLYVDSFKNDKDVLAILLICSCARGKASRDSCVDMGFLVKPGTLCEFKVKSRVMEEAIDQSDVIKAFNKAGAFCEVHHSFFDGNFKPGTHHWTSGPDEFELEIGNHVKYAVPLLEKGNHFQELKDKWLPYYSDELREKRMKNNEKFFTNHVKHIPLYAKRGLVFEAFHRLYLATQEFLQFLFIKNRTYPISYTKWIEEQLVDILGLPELFPRFKSALELPSLDVETFSEKEELLWQLGTEYLELDAP
ncbi:MAG: hypothetical protein ACFFCS_10575 [Candidatus Hodarchaeota archaeon]